MQDYLLGGGDNLEACNRGRSGGPPPGIYSFSHKFWILFFTLFIIHAAQWPNELSHL